MDLKDFWKNRQYRHTKKMVRYLQYVFNDHFILFLFILVGGLIYLYSQSLKSIDLSQQWPLVVAAIILSLLVFVGQFANFLVDADSIFLTPLEEKMDPILKHMRRRSWFIAAIPLLAVSLLVVPLLVAYGLLSFQQWWLLTVVLLILKIGELLSQQAMMKEWGKPWSSQRLLINGFIYLAIFMVFIFVHPWLAVCLSLLYVLLCIVLYRSFFHAKRWNWAYMIDKEGHRQKKQLHLINLFTDVPEIQSPAKRRKFLDGLVKSFPKSQTNPCLYAMVRRFFRSSEHFNLYVRLVLIGGLLVCLAPYSWLSLLLGVLFIYLIGFQLIPLGFSEKNIHLKALFPMPDDLRHQSTQQFLAYILLVASLMFGLLGFWQTDHWALSFLNGLLYLLFSYSFAKWYVPGRLKKK